MQKVLTAEQMREVDRQTTEKYGIPSILLMENAAHAAARIITEKLGGSVAGKSFLILCGKGNNGGDGAALARVLWSQGAHISVLLFGKIARTKDDAKTNFRIAEHLGEVRVCGQVKNGEHIIDVVQYDENFFFRDVYFKKNWNQLFEEISSNFAVVIDAILGTGGSGSLEGDYLQAVRFGMPRGKYRVSIDVPSGLNADASETSGKSYSHFKADLTITFTAPKLANVFPPASKFNGELVVANIGSPQELIDAAPSQTFVAEKQDAQDWLNKTRVKIDSYKKTRGTALIVAGSKNYSGAAVLAANACFAAGAGMVSVGVPESVKAIVAAKVSDEIITKGFDETKSGAFAETAAKDALELSERMNVVAIGCGLTSNDESTRRFVREVIEKRGTPVVIDADGLNSLAPFDLKGSEDLPLILTPHIGEFQRLLGTTDEIKDRIETAREFSQKHNVILLLKGERSIVAAPDGSVVINPTGNAGISRAGSGDTLTGIITGFLAQAYGVEKPNLDNTFEAVIAALYISGSAGDIAAEKFGQRLMTATDIRDCLGEAIEKLTADERE